METFSLFRCGTFGAFSLYFEMSEGFWKDKYLPTFAMESVDFTAVWIYLKKF